MLYNTSKPDMVVIIASRPRYDSTTGQILAPLLWISLVEEPRFQILNYQGYIINNQININVCE